MTDEGTGRADGSRRRRGSAPPGWTAEDVDHDRASRQVMRLLGEHVPISLLLDVSARAGPDSEHLLTAEGGVDHAWWEPGPAVHSTPPSTTPRPT